MDNFKLFSIIGIFLILTCIIGCNYIRFQNTYSKIPIKKDNTPSYGNQFIKK